MKLAVISYHTCPYEPFGSGFSGGMNVFLRELLEHLSLSGVSVYIYTRSLSGDSVSVKNDRLKVYHIECGLPQAPTLIDYLEKVDGFSERIRRKVPEGTDVVFSNYWLSSPPALALKARQTVRVVHMNHTLEKVKEAYTQSTYASGRLHHARLFWEFCAQKFSDLLIFPSERDREVSTAFYPFLREKSHVLYPGISEEILDVHDEREKGRAALGVSGDAFLFLSSGRDERTKNIVQLATEFHKLDHEEARLVVIGKGPWGSGERMVTLPPRSRESLVPILDASDCVVVPSFYESFGFFGMEALARGKPLVAARGTFLGDLVGQHDLGALFDAGKEGSLTRALESIIEQRSRFRERAAVISSAVSRFTWERASSRFLRVLSQHLRA